MVRLTGTCLTVNATAGVLDGGSEAATPGSFVGLTDTRCSTVWQPPTPSQTGPQFCPKECTMTTEVAVRCCRVRLRHPRSRTQADRREVVDGNAPSRRQCRVEGQAVR